MPKKEPPFRSVATRYLRIEGSRAKVKVELSKPYPSKNDYGCDFRILYAGKMFRHAIYGVDEFQSLQLALRLLPTVLRHTAWLPIKKMYLHELRDDLGFPEVMGK